MEITITNSPNTTNMCRRIAEANERKVWSYGLVSWARGRGERRAQEGVRGVQVKRPRKWGHPRREAHYTGADELTLVNEYLLVGDPLEQARALKGGRGASEDGVLKGLRGLRTVEASHVRLSAVP